MFEDGFKGKNVFVTGGSKGIGRAIVDKYMKMGANVAFTYNQSTQAVDEILDSYSNCIGTIKAYSMNLENQDMISSVCKEVLKDFGAIDTLVNNAGITRDAYLLMQKKDNISDVINVNLTSMMLVTQAILPSMVRQGKGTIINISSISGIYGNVGQTNYAASKSGILGFTKSLSLEVASMNIRVNSVSPGYIETDMLNAVPSNIRESYINTIPMRRLGAPSEIADVVAFLSSDMSSFITGQNISVAGGI